MGPGGSGPHWAAVRTESVHMFAGDLFWDYTDQDLLELTPKKDVHFITGDWNAKVGSQETPGVTGRFGLELQSKAGQRVTEFCLIA